MGFDREPARNFGRASKAPLSRQGLGYVAGLRHGDVTCRLLLHVTELKTQDLQQLTCPQCIRQELILQLQTDREARTREKRLVAAVVKVQSCYR